MLLIYMPNYREKSNAVYRPSQLKQRLDEDGETALSLPSTLAGAWHSNSILMIRGARIRFAACNGGGCRDITSLRDES